MTITLTPSEFSEDIIYWQPNNGRRYSIRKEGIFPKRIADQIDHYFKQGLKSITFTFFEYDSKNKILMIGMEKPKK